MISRKDYFDRVMVLGQYCYPERAEEAVLLVLSCLKHLLSEEAARGIKEMLPEPVRGLWEEAVFNNNYDEDEVDCITLAKRLGNYPYRAAAERAFEVVFASIRELTDEQRREAIKTLPLTVQPLFERAKSCAIDGSAEDFL
ncbi:MAG: DUF2267 domain-containing protein [Nitrospirae bacterium]|nr:DUF2267 domain-containing protein [Nitrospirota bacterium]